MRRARRPVAAQVRLHGGGVEVEAVGAGGVGVAVLGDRQGDDGRAGRRDGGGHRVRLAVGDEHAGVHRGHGHPRAVGGDLHHGVAQVLGAHRVRDGGRAAGDAEDPPRPVGVGQRGGGVDGLVGAVEVAQPEVHDPGLGHGAAVQEGGGGSGRRAEGRRGSQRSPVRHGAVAAARDGQVGGFVGEPGGQRPRRPRRRGRARRPGGGGRRRSSRRGGTPRARRPGSPCTPGSRSSVWPGRRGATPRGRRGRRRTGRAGRAGSARPRRARRSGAGG